ncbi:WhiB family transcriptional regulator [Streptomyces sp. SCL15-4]|uniref:WhiB family transcriptional regulator n=1 Tax=Streptomyces sp. SCL15-4 TaxID=2967221 RepID=UPI00296662BC|nr:WhiB family transcriptional regulator [Streptomyces sp. SCL15-4]
MTHYIGSVPDPERARHWRDEAACRDANPDDFFSENTHIVNEARKVCISCPVRQQCAAYALEHGEWWGTWGGMTQTQLRTHRGRRRAGRHAA